MAAKVERRKGVWFVADTHLGLRMGDPVEREERFVRFLKSVPRDSEALYMLGDIWDFWYEYRDVIPKMGARVIAELINLSDAGVGLFFAKGNHDMWTKDFFESLGIRIIDQPHFVNIHGKVFCLGHGDDLGKAPLGYRILLSVFRCRFARALFSTIHPWIAYRLGYGWSNRNRRRHKPYHFKGEEEPLYRWACGEKADFFIFGHFHDAVDLTLPSGARFVVLDDWMKGGMPNAYFDGETLRINA